MKPLPHFEGRELFQKYLRTIFGQFHFLSTIYRITALSSLLLWPANMRSIILKKIIWAKSIKTKISTEVAVGLVASWILHQIPQLKYLTTNPCCENYLYISNMKFTMKLTTRVKSFIKSRTLIPLSNQIKNCDTFSGHLTLNPGKLSNSPV